MTSTTSTSSTTTTTDVRTSARTASKGRQALLLLAAIVVASVANAIVAVAAIGAGADPSMMALLPGTYVLFTAVGLLVGYLGWRLVRRFSRRPARVLAVLVPVMLVLSWVPDLTVIPSQPGSSVTGIVALMIMHVVAVLVAVPVYRRIAPVA